MRNLSVFVAFLVALGGFISPCQAQYTADDDANIVNVEAEDYAFQAPDEIPSGWTTIRYQNKGDESHFLFLTRLPEGKTYNEYAGNVIQPFNEIWYAMRDEGLTTEQVVERLGAEMPEWFWGVEFKGGTGMISPGRSSDVTVDLEAGTYVLECYMKTEEGELHSMEGMLRELIVNDTPSETTQPQADININLSNFEMVIDGNLTPGSHTVSVHVEENPEEGFGHNVHVARLGPDTNAEEVAGWMNWFDVNGLRTPSPTTFVGGMHLLPVGETGYFNLDLEPGRYLFYSEYTGHLGVMQEVLVEE